MSAFQVNLPDGNHLTGTNHFPEKPSRVATVALPLIVAVHGGGYSSDYFDADEKHSVRFLSQALGIPVIAIDRPGYCGSSPLGDTPAQSSFIQESGKYLHQTILPFLWKEYSARLGASSIFIYAHSIGAAISIVAASLHETEKISSAYPLSGISISGVGLRPRPFPSGGPDAPKNLKIRLPKHISDIIMLGPSHSYDPAILKQTERLQHDGFTEEIYDITTLWQEYWKRYAAQVGVSILYSLGEYDALWENSDLDVKDFADGFAKAPVVEARRLRLAPHCIEHSLQGSILMLRTFCFAIESAVYKMDKI